MLTGSLVALITPMNSSGSVDWKALELLIEYHIQSGTNGLVVAGTTGESVTLTDDELFILLERTLELAAGRIPIIAGCGSNNTAHAKQVAKRICQLGVTAGLSVTPYYNKPTQEGLYQHFAAIGEYSELPQILYNVPGRTACDLKPETVARLAGNFGICGIKEATGDLSRISQLRLLCGEDFALYSGDDLSACEFMLQGGNGVISVTANVAAKLMSRMSALALAGERELACEIDDSLRFLHRDLFIESNPIPVKWAAARMGLIKNADLRLPLTLLSVPAQAIVEAALVKAELI
ncbi:4-hydroxy-tetrahydrodipicolinate synthase [Tolumonas lignilytica]|uniref:4-hydroxy-tetrahydrodipicolinate synthase n=1 Tax=Tolumonas lignilytica TaxID=1283284 RepID=UPI000466106C|nr:4-hydroxy-tetrahydrodipicolinate synthase [Tolumonas lignilytica]